MVCINKYDLNPEQTEKIVAIAQKASKLSKIKNDQVCSGAGGQV